MASAEILTLPNVGAAGAYASTGERLIRLPQVLELVGLGKTTIYALMKGDEFPQPRKVRNVSLWVESEVQSWIRSIAQPAA
ncbi:AlpA family phage regulatory protein [Burkholderia sp. Ac-20384]|nr:AlpA family phage regulatory protein [Burkholderia sp. Ac-20384]